VEGVCVSNAVDDRGRADLRRMGGWAAYCQAAVQIRDRLSAATPDAISA
jgi:chromosome partitioning protein